MTVGTGFALPGGVPLHAAVALDILEQAVDQRFDPVLVTEVNGVSALSLTAALAARNAGVHTGTGIIPLGSVSEPALAMSAATVAQVADAPFLLGVGTSSPQIVAGWHGAEYDATLDNTRVRLRALRRVLNGEPRGSFALTVPPADRVRVLLGALGPGMIELAFDEAAGAIVNHTPPSALPAPPPGKLLLAYVWVLASDDGEERARRQLVSYAMAPPYARHFARLGFETAVQRVAAQREAGRLRDAPETLPQEMVDLFYARPSELATTLAEYRRAGAHPVVLPVTGDRPPEEAASLLQDVPADNGQRR